MNDEARQGLRDALETFIGPTLPSAGNRPAGLLMAFRAGEAEVGLLFYSGAGPGHLWVQPGSGKGRFTDISDPLKSLSFPLHIAMSCGQSVVYGLAEDIPAISEACPCGDPQHSLVEYMESAQAKPAEEEPK